MKTFNELREATSGRKGVECSAKKSQFGGYTPTCMRGNKLVYSAQQSYKDETTAKKHAEVYADAYYSMGDRASQNAVRKFVDQNKDKLYTKNDLKKESVEETRKYKAPTAAEIEADKKKDRKSRPSMSAKSASKNVYKNLRDDLEENFAVHKNGKPLKIKGKEVTARSKEAAQKAIDTMKKQPFNKDAKFTIVEPKSNSSSPQRTNQPYRRRYDSRFANSQVAAWRYAERGE